MLAIDTKLHSEMDGRYLLIRRGPNGEVRGESEAGESPNLITNIGLDRMAANKDFTNQCYVGGSSSTPLFTDTQLGTLTATTSSATVKRGVLGVLPYYAWMEKTYRFDAGAAAGNLSEVGVGWAASGGLFSRALILDPNGNPTSITVLPDETLDVVYIYRLYPKLSDTTGSFVLTGSAGGEYDFVFRACNAGNPTNSGGTFEGWGVCDPSGLPFRMDEFLTTVSGSGGGRGFTGGLGPTTGIPSGDIIASGTVSIVAEPYVAGSHQSVLAITLGLSSWNGLLRTMVRGIGPAAYQIEFNPPIPKTPDDELTLRIAHSWGRREE